MSNIRSFDELNKKEGDDKGKFNEYYAGGEKSGQVLRGAPKDEESGDEDTVGELFNRAKLTEAYQGTLRTLGDESGAQNADGAGRTHIITFYRNDVFQVDNNPPRSVKDPANFAFIDSLAKGECPAELDPGSRNIQVMVKLERRDEDYAEAAQPKYTAFQGQGRTLGGSSAVPSTSQPIPSTSGLPVWNGVDASLPVTSLQLRLADGSRMVARFNHSHRIADIRSFIYAARPNEKAPYQLLTSFPSAPIVNEERTLEEAGLLNAVILQKY